MQSSDLAVVEELFLMKPTLSKGPDGFEPQSSPGNLSVEQRHCCDNLRGQFSRRCGISTHSQLCQMLEQEQKEAFSYKEVFTSSR